MSERVLAEKPVASSIVGRTLHRCGCGKATTMGGECAECKKKLSRRAEDGTFANPEVAPPIVHDVLRSAGRPLDAASRAYFEPRFRHDFSKVRVHSDSSASRSAQAVDALAYTVGNNIAFAHGRYSPESTTGRHLLAHELAHVVQQNSSVSGDSGPIEIGPTNSPLETSANNAAVRVTAGDAASVWNAGDSSLARMEGGRGCSLLSRASDDGSSKNDCGKDGRPLNATERSGAKDIFGTTLDEDAVCIKESWAKTVGGYYRTIGDTIYVPNGEKNTISTHRVMHELTHTWQSHHGVSLATQTVAAIRGNYDYGGEAGLNDAIKNKKCFTDFNTEQQGDIVEDYYSKSQAGASTYPWSVFIDQVRADGQCVWYTPPILPPGEFAG